MQIDHRITPFFGRSSELAEAERIIEGRVGDQLGFSGIGGLGKSTLLGQIAARARELGITPYIVSIALRDDTTPLGFFRMLLDSLRATGRTTRRHMLILRKDTLDTCEKLLKRLEQQEIFLTKRNEMTVIASDGGTIGAPTLNLQEQNGVETTVLFRDLKAAFVRLVSDELPDLVKLPDASSSVLPRRLVILLVDNLELASPDMLELLHALRSGQLSERVILFSVGRVEPRFPDKSAKPLLPRSLQHLSSMICHVWLTRSGVTDEELRGAIVDLCQGVPLLIRLCLADIEAVRGHGEVLHAADFRLAPAGEGGEHGLAVVEEFLVGRFIERFERAGSEGALLSKLVRYGCVLRTFSDRDALRALQIDGVTTDPDVALRALDSRGLLSANALHPIVRQAALVRLRGREPQTFRQLCERASSYFLQAGRVDEHLYMRILAGERSAAEDLQHFVRQALANKDVRAAERLIRAVELLSNDDSWMWQLSLARADLAIAQGDRSEAEQQLAQLLPLIQQVSQDYITDYKARLAALEPIQNIWLLYWWLPQQPDTSERTQQLARLANVFTQQSKHAEAATIYALISSTYTGDNKSIEKANVLLDLGKALQGQGDYRAAQEHYEQALVLYRHLRRTVGEAHALYHLGEVLQEQGDYRAAQGYYEQALVLYRQMGRILGQDGETHALLGLGEVLQGQDDYRAAQGYYQQALVLYRQMRRIPSERRGRLFVGEANALLGLGEILLWQGDHRTAQGHFEQALELHRQLRRTLGQARARLGLGKALQGQGDYRAAQEHYEQALVLYRQIAHTLGEANALLDLGKALQEQGDYRAAQEHCEQALVLHQQLRRTLGQARARLGLGKALQGQGDYRAAQEHYEQALVLYRQIAHTLGEANALLDLGKALQEQGDYRAAQEHYEQALVLYRQIAHTLGEANALLCLGEVQRLQGVIALARSTLEHALNVSRQSNYHAGQWLALASLIAIAKLQGEHEKAKALQRAHQELVANRR